MNQEEHPLIDSETAQLLGGEVTEIEPADDEIEIQLAVREIRDHLLAAAQHDGVGVNQFARRLTISPSSVSRFFSSEGDIRVSTAVLYARALGRRWNFELGRDPACEAYGNHARRPEIVYGHDTSSKNNVASLSVANVPNAPSAEVSWGFGTQAKATA